jgi:hypothetical protein
MAATRATTAAIRQGGPTVDWTTGCCRLVRRGIRRQAHFGDQPVTTLGDRLDVLGLFGRVTQGLAEFDHRLGKHLVAHDDTRPHRGQQLFPAHDLPRAVGERDQHVHRLGLQADRFGVPLQLVGWGIDAPLPHLEPGGRRSAVRFSQHRKALETRPEEPDSPLDQFLRKTLGNPSGRRVAVRVSPAFKRPPA